MAILTATTLPLRRVSASGFKHYRGLTDSLNVIDAQRQEYAIEEQYVLAQQSAAADFVSLCKSIGSGWEDYQVFPPAVAAAFRSLIQSGPTP